VAKNASEEITAYSGRNVNADANSLDDEVRLELIGSKRTSLN
jgi:hypothetical protein